jgi:hypothetical protein
MDEPKDEGPADASFDEVLELGTVLAEHGDGLIVYVETIPIAFIFIWLIVILSQALWGEGACQGIWC